MLVVFLALATAGAPAIGIGLALWLNADADHSHHASLAIEHGEIHLVLHHGKGQASKADVEIPRVGEADHELYVSDPNFGLVNGRRDASQTITALLTRSVEPARIVRAQTSGLSFGFDPDPPPSSAPPVLRV